jgi:hypothetical protein
VSAHARLKGACVNASDILKYGHRTVLGALADIPAGERDTPGVCGIWSVQDIVAHLASYEQVLAEVLASFLGGGPTPHLDAYRSGPGFNDDQVALRTGKGWDEVLGEYQSAQARTMDLVARVPAETLRQPGTLPWYGAEYALDDFIVYAFYGHKREHMAQVNVFKDTLAGRG